MSIPPLVIKHTGEARWIGYLLATYTKHIQKGTRCVVDVMPQGFQMIAMPEQLNYLHPVKWDEEIVLGADYALVSLEKIFVGKAKEGRSSGFIYLSNGKEPPVSITTEKPKGAVLYRMSPLTIT